MNRLKKLITRISSSAAIAVAILGLLGAGLGSVSQAFATTYMTHASVLEYNMVAAGTSQVVVAFTAGAADAGPTLTVNFGGWTGTTNGIVNTTQTINTTGCQALTGATNVLPSGTMLAAAGATSIVTVSNVGALTSGQSYCFDLTSASAVTNPTTAGQSNVVITDGTDTASTELDVISASPGDAVTVTATVPPSFTLGLSGNTDTFASNLSSGSTVVTTGVTATISTNADSGWGLWAEDSQGGLHSAAESSLIATVAPGSIHTFTTNSNQYGLGVATNPTANYAYGAGTTGGGLSTTAFNEIASNSAPAAGLTTVIHELADISGSTPAAQDYTDTITIVGDGSF
jgi:hypothetical protein